MKKVLLVSRKGQNCGVNDYGKRLAEIVKKSKIYNTIHVEVETTEELIDQYNLNMPDIIIYNYIKHIFDFLPKQLTSVLSNLIPQIVIHHEGHIDIAIDGILSTNSSLSDNEDQNIFILPRPLFEDVAIENTDKNTIPTIGSFGFGFWNKNFPKIAEIVCNEFDEAMLRLNIPYSTFGDSEGIGARGEIEKIQNIIKESGKKIHLEYSHEFLNHNDLLKFLSNNDVNVFLYEKFEGRGLSSTIDYALSARKPIAVNDSYMFRHINDVTPSIIFSDSNTLSDIIKNGIEPLKSIYNKHSNKSLIDKYEYALTTIRNNRKQNSQN